MAKRAIVLLLTLSACTANIDLPINSTSVKSPNDPSNPTPPADPLPVINTCTAPGTGTPARMRLLWQDAYLAEITARFGADAATAASSVIGLSLPTDKDFRFDSAGSLVTTDAISSLADSADAVAVWALSTDAIATQVFGCNARTVTGTTAETCFTSFLSGAGARLLRRPMTSAEIADTLTFFRAEVTAGDGTDSQEGFRQGLASLLTHPDFLYLRDRTTGMTSTTIDTFALASRISFALIGRGPDDALYAAATDGSIAQPEVIKAQVARLLATPDARTEAVKFYEQWTGYILMASPAYSPAFLNGLDVTGLRDAALAELDAFTAALTFDRNGTPGDLMTSTYLPPVTGPLANIYGTASGANDIGQARSGLLTRVGMMASGGDDWSIVGRGVPMLRNLLCRPLSPPANVDIGAAAAQAEMLKLSYRDRFDTITAPAGCQACHHYINPLGAAQSDFDAVGRTITVEMHYAGGVFDFQEPVNAKADVSSDLGPNTVVNGAVDLSKALAASTEYSACFANRFVAKSLGRIEPLDGCVAMAGEQVVENKGTIIDTMSAVFASPDFAVWHE